MKVLYASTIKETHLQQLRELVEDTIQIVQIPRDSLNTLDERAREFDAVIGARLSKEFLENADNLMYYIIPFAGIPEKDKKNLKNFPAIQIMNSHYNAPFVAEHAWGLLLACTKKICPIHQKMKRGDWRPRYNPSWWGNCLKGKNLLVLGYGEIGRKIARIGKAFRMTVKAIKRTPKKAEKIDFIGTRKDLPKVLPEADFIIVTLPLTNSTRGFFGSKEFKMMQEGVYIINVGRGPVIDEKVFYEHLKSGKIAGAAIDTWWKYPSDEEARSNTKPSKYPLHELDNIIFSPHRSSHVKEREKYRIQDLAKTLNQLVHGKLRNTVDLGKGY